MPFKKLVEQIRQGDSAAYETLLREYGPQILREARDRLGRSPARSLCDSEDICQSVLGSFFRRVSTGHYQLEHPSQLAALLVSMARNKAIDRVRAAQLAPWANAEADRRSESLVTDAHAQHLAEDVEARELFDHYHTRLTADNRDILCRRIAGQTWAEIADALGRRADALRKQFQRALQAIDEP